MHPGCVLLIKGYQNKTSYILFALTQQLHDTNEYKFKWATTIKSILDDCGHSFLWDFNSDVNSEWIKSSIQQRLRDIDLQSWQCEVDNNSLCLNYKVFKSSLNMEKYLLKLNPIDRISLSKFRCSSHRLPVIAGRYLQENMSRFCNLCELNVVGDEYHYLLVCPTFAAERRSFIKQYYRNNPSMLKMSQLMNTTNVKIMADIAKFCQIIMSKF